MVFVAVTVVVAAVVIAAEAASEWSNEGVRNQFRSIICWALLSRQGEIKLITTIGGGGGGGGGKECVCVCL